MADYQHGTPILINDTFYVAGTETDPTTVVYTIVDPSGDETTYTWPGAPEISHPGVGEFSLALGTPSIVGLYHYDVDATGTVVASRAGSFTVLANVSSVDVDWAVAGPCSSWASSQDAWGYCGNPTVEIDGVICNVDFTSEVMAASQVLFELSGRRFAGLCSKTVRPCGRHSCNFQVLSRGHVIGWEGNTWWWDGNRGCGCQPLDTILLSGYPVREITEVKINGDVVDPDTYRLDERRYLRRVRDPANPSVVNLWPACQALDLPDTEDGTFSVSYRYGMEPPLIASDAAAELACELYKAWNGLAECALPSGVTRISRQGVVIERMAFAAWGLHLGIWKTGLTRVDTFLNAYNVPRLRRRPSLYSPDGMQYARPVGQ